jgi:hypothetical protein
VVTVESDDLTLEVVFQFQYHPLALGSPQIGLSVSTYWRANRVIVSAYGRATRGSRRT